MMTRAPAAGLGGCSVAPSAGDPGRPQPMEGGHDLLVDRFTGTGVYLVVAIGFESALASVRSVLLRRT